MTTEPDEGTRLILPSMEQKALIDALLGKRSEPRMIGLHEQAHKLSPEERRARRVKNKAKRQKASAGRTASLTACQKALAEAKGSSKRRREAHRHLHAKG